MHPLDLVGASAWRRAIFTTYALSLSFFEAVILDRLVRAGARNTLILSDPEGIRAGLSEQGARRVGREYELEPLACSTGVLHSKLSVLFGEDDAHLLVSSGNLTFGGWGVNLETVDHLHPSFAGDAFDDAADFFELLAIDDRITCGIADELAAIGEQLRRAALSSARTGDIRLVHNVGRSIIEQLAEYAGELGGARHITVVSPFFDPYGKAVDQLGKQLNCPDVRLHVHPAETVQGLPGSNWPSKTTARAVNVRDPFGQDPRRLHAKCFEIVCRRGRLLMSGSANATLSALETGNIEASVVRMQRETSVAWAMTDAKPPPKITNKSEDDQEENEARVGVLRASLDGETIQGLIIEPKISGVAGLSRVRTSGSDDLGEIVIDAAGRFSATAPMLEVESWQSGRIVVRVEQGEKIAEGFVSVSAAAEIIRRVGTMAPRILAMLAGTETPADVAAIFSWMNEDSQRLFAFSGGGSASAGSGDQPAVWVPIEVLHAPQLPSTNSIDGSGDRNTQAWQRSWAMFCASFSKARGPWGSLTELDDRSDDEAEDEVTRAKRIEVEDDAKAKAMATFDELLDSMLVPENDGRHASMAFALAHYLADRNRPAPVKVQTWLERILNSFQVLDENLTPGVIAAGLLLRASDESADAPARARRFLLKHGVDPQELIVTIEDISGFVESLAPEWDSAAFVELVRTVRTPGEEVRDYLRASETSGAPGDIRHLRSSRHWSRLEHGLKRPDIRAKFVVVDDHPKACPTCSIVFSCADYEELRSFGVTRCCRLILSTEV